GLAADPRLDVVGAASDARDARTLVNALRPDVIALDLDLPLIGGVSFLRRLMAARPTPVVVLSDHRPVSDAAAARALADGAFACVAKPSSPDPGPFADLSRAVRAAHAASRRTTGAGAEADPVERLASPARQRGRAASDPLILIGASTGGMDAIERVVADFPIDCPPTLIAQHMPASFSEGFAARLDAATAPAVSLAADGAPLRRGCVFIAPGGARHLRLALEREPVCRLEPGAKVCGHRPSVDALFLSAAPFAPAVAAALLTGIGADGAEGLAALRAKGAATFAQDEASSTVYGMPKAALALGAVDAATKLDDIARRLLEACARAAPASWRPRD
ncbi:MAG: chemotaxis protein CheB, partial [Pseudomonadota bacterium]